MKRWILVAGFGFGIVASAQDATPPPAQPLPVPMAACPIERPNWSDRSHVFFNKVFGRQAILETIPGASFDMARKFPQQWARTAGGAAKRIGSQYGQFVVGETIEMAVSSLHREDPRYFRTPGDRFSRRLGHALASTVIVRGADGSKTIALARLANVYGSWAVATTWNPPEQRDFGKIVAYGTLGLGIKAGSNLFREFWPDVKSRFGRP